ncbi:hypothetical protein BGZ63DRAFT_379198 [Mariannaea sp. PMI_226]|nr:hypothetical protein BGZ63DRAFT_379198 [Mariannaea sp. PMI_226]
MELENAPKDLEDVFSALDLHSGSGWKPFSERLFSALTDAEKEKLMTQFKADVRDGTRGMKPDDAAVQRELKLKNRRSSFVSAALPTLRAQLVQSIVVRAIGEIVPGLEPSVLAMLANGREAFNNNTIGATDKIREICTDFLDSSAKSGATQSAFFCPAATDTYQFQIPAADSKDENKKDDTKAKQQETPTFSINGVNLPLIKTSKGDAWQTAPIVLSTGQPYTLSASVSLKTAHWVNKQSSQPVEFSMSALIPVNIISSVSDVLSTVLGFAEIVKRLDLGLEEFKYLSSTSQALVRIDLEKPSIKGLCTLETYRNLRDSLSGDRDALVSLFAWLQGPTKDKGSVLASQLSKATGWQVEQLETMLSLKYPGLEPEEIVARFASSIDELVALQAIKQSSGRLSASRGQRVAQPLLILFEAGTPTAPTVPTSFQPVEPGQAKPSTLSDKDLRTASAMQLCLGPGQLAQCNRDIRESQRTVLVQFLLQQNYIQRLGIADADGLFAHFMLDVQMGAQLEITRMKAAISTVQLFVQRVLLGLEAKAGVLDARVKKDNWAWMQRHNIWQATRKAFLYPENWIEPSLRDDKTPLFEAFETALMSKDLSWDTFSQAIRAYVQELQGIADLDIVAYLREVRKEESEIYHFFGRTRSAPFEFFYRTFRIIRAGSGDGLAFWSPWTRIGVEAPTYETNWDGATIKGSGSGSYLVPVIRNHRVFLYLPQLVAKSQPPKLTGSLKAMAEKEIPEGMTASLGPCTWEIRMGWTELVDGQWTPKRMSQSSVVVDWVDATETAPGYLPSIDSFVFSAEAKEANVTIQVGCRRKDAKFLKLGKFDVNDERVVAVTFDSTNQTTSPEAVLKTSFHKYLFDAKPNLKTNIGTLGELQTPSDVDYSSGTKENPLLALNSREYQRDMLFTLSYARSTNNTKKTTGLVFDEQIGGAANGTTTFMYPSASSIDNSVGSATLYKSSKEEIIEHSASREMMEAICKPVDGLGSLFQTMDEKLVRNHDYGKTVVRSDMSNYHELTSSYAIYNWELGLHAVLLAVDRFHTSQQFELALKAARLVFDPTTTPLADCSAAQAAAACWKFRPFRDLAEDKAVMADKFGGWPSDGTLELAVSERRSNPSSSHSTARGRPQAYMKWIVMKYIEILIAAGDQYFRQGSMETLPLAIQRYVEAAHVLGADPPRVPRLAKAAVRTFKNIGDVGKTIDLELAFPFLCEVERRGSGAPNDKRRRSDLLCILTTTYFSLPPNPQYASLRTLVQDRLYKARNNLDINGRPIVYSMSEPFIDPGQAMRALSGGGAGGVGSLMNDADSPMPYQRFSFLIGKALELCNELRSMSEQFLSVREKRDGEALALLKTRQDMVKQKMALEIKNLQAEEITKTIESLQQNREAAVSQLEYFLRLTGDPLELIPKTEKDGWEDIAQNILAPISDDLRMSPLETMEMASAAVAGTLNVAAAGMETLIGILKAIPSVTTNAQPMGCGVTVKADAGNAAELTHGIMGATKMYALIASEASSMSARIGGLTKQLQDRRMQANAKGREIKNLDKQIEIQRTRLDINAKELVVQQTEIEHATETEAWYRSKYTNEQLYGWLESSIRAIHYDLYTLVSDMCRRAERAFRFERGHQVPTSFLRSGGYWDSSRDGLMAAQQLSLDLRRMEAAYLLKPAHDWELVKNVSLRKIDPRALLTLRETGTATFSLPELLFDMDFPGHYMRRLKAVAVSIPCIVGPHATLAATLSLVQHTYRVSAAAPTTESYLSASSSDGSFRTDPVPLTAVATSTAMQDTGSFDIAFNAGSGGNDMRYGPFEGAGAISSWKLELPPKSMQTFDYSSIADVVLHIKYTAVDGGPVLKRSAAQAVAEQCARQENLGERDGLWGFLEPRNELSGEWYSFKASLAQKGVDRKATLDLGAAIASRLPFWARDKSINIESLCIVITGGDADLPKDLRIPALGVVDWDKTDLGNRMVLSRAGLSGAEVSVKQPADKWRLTVTRDKTKACDIQDMDIYFRYVLAQDQATS